MPKGRKLTGSFSRKVKYFDENFDIKIAVAEGSINLATNLSEAHSLLGADEKEIVRAINLYAKGKAIDTAIEGQRGQGLDEKVVMKFIRPFREVPPYDEMEPKDATVALIKQVKDTPFMLNAIRAASLAGSDGENDTEELVD